ncbi:hypothetical protein BKA82DRAFT_619682 [Pisolithus tinctorius]|uniref:Uncharacterized protein n=1 Tax=Pisolithus tinctorius Marx 270 TaxID=870435 RepID=A0A0C3J2Y9_PISTI|nr:hypothetical protein BKA82DRAFT_619682 [Pisolithus tinctorius]KIO03428.1 hypothetical protein M404DRAFT_619682 [Pisolithus tinctorius Marx 270]
MHHRGSSPVFDTPEFPPLRRLKPLPKRRRTSDCSTGTVVANHDVDILNLPAPRAGFFGGAQSIGEELIMQAGSLTSQIALQSYYASLLTSSGVGIDDAHDGSARGILNEAHAEDLSGSLGQSLDLNTVFPHPTDERFTSERQDEDQSEGDSIDHLQHPGNTKKRKVPMNMSRSASWLELPLRGEGDIADVALSMGQFGQDLDFLVAPLPVAQTTRKGKISPSALAGLQHKELLKHRKRQLATVLGALSLGDILPLDQAISTHIPFVSTMLDASFDTHKVRLSHRRGPRLARAAKVKALSDASNRAVFPTAQFTFSYPSATSEHLLATKQEMLALRSRFEAELARQTSKAAKTATQAKKAGVESTKTSRPKRSEKAQQRPRTVSIDRAVDLSKLPSLGKSGRNKKKTSVASDQQDRKNYVPSRLAATVPSNQANANLNVQNLLGTHPFRFLSANIPPRRRKKAVVTPTAQIIDPEEEWICPHCEYSLFYSDGPEYKRAIRNRKKALQRRRRAQERAAGGLSTPKTLAKAASVDGNYDDYGQFSARSPAISKSSEWKQGLDVKGVKGQQHLQSG